MPTRETSSCSVLASAMSGAERALRVLVECDTGAHRYGVQTPESACELAQIIAAAEGLSFHGLMTYPPAGRNVEADDWLAKAKILCEKSDRACSVISSGGTPDMWLAENLSNVTEYRAGTYIYNDRSLIARGVCTAADCALSVLATLVSSPTADRAVLDAGSKSLTSDLLGLEGFGFIPAVLDATINALNEEHGYLDLSRAAIRPGVGDKIRIIPNHACVVSNLFDRVYAVRGTEVLGTMDVSARGCSQ
jgi:D-serine deaminase-like pyridoxal phosphate-dependent protein